LKFLHLSLPTLLGTLSVHLLFALIGPLSGELKRWRRFQKSTVEQKEILFLKDDTLFAKIFLTSESTRGSSLYSVGPHRSARPCESCWLFQS